MLLSREKINCISKEVIETLDQDELVDFIEEPNDVRLKIVEIITKELELEDIVDEKVKKTLSSYGRNIQEGTSEWEVMYKKLYEEEIAKKQHI